MIKAISHYLNEHDIPSYPVEFLNNKPFLRIPRQGHHFVDIYQDKTTIRLFSNLENTRSFKLQALSGQWDIADPRLLPELITTIKSLY